MNMLTVGRVVAEGQSRGEKIRASPGDVRGSAGTGPLRRVRASDPARSVENNGDLSTTLRPLGR